MLSSQSVRERKWPRSRLDLIFNLTDLKYGASFSSTPIALRSKAKPKLSSVTFQTKLKITPFSDIVFTLPDVEVTIQKYLWSYRLRLSCHPYSFQGVHDLFNQKLDSNFTTNFRARSFCSCVITGVHWLPETPGKTPKVVPGCIKFQYEKSKISLKKEIIWK